LVESFESYQLSAISTLDGPALVPAKRAVAGLTWVSVTPTAIR